MNKFALGIFSIGFSIFTISVFMFINTLSRIADDINIINAHSSWMVLGIGVMVISIGLKIFQYKG